MNYRFLHSASLALLCLGLASAAMAQVSPIPYHTDDFNSNTSANYTLIDASPASPSDNAVTFAVDYSALTSPGGAAIPVAPRTTDSSQIGLRTEVNLSGGNDGTVTLYPNIPAISGDHRIIVDAFFAVSNSGGSTEDMLVGVFHAGDKSINFGQEADAGQPIETDGYFMHLAGEAGWASTDVVFLEGNPAAADTLLDLPDFQWAGDTSAETGSTPTTTDSGVDAGTSFIGSEIYPNPPFTFAGGPGEAWTTIEVRSVGGVVSVLFDDQLICTYDDPDDTYTSGVPSFGHEDFFGSQGNGFVIWDNLVVEPFIPVVDGGAGGSSQTVDGTLDSSGYDRIGLQTVQTQFGDETTGDLAGTSGGNELDSLYVTNDLNNLFVLTTGNLQGTTGDNTIYILIDDTTNTSGVTGEPTDLTSIDGLFENDGLGGVTMPDGFDIDYAFVWKSFNSDADADLELIYSLADYNAGTVFPTTNPGNLDSGQSANPMIVSDNTFTGLGSTFVLGMDNSNTAGVVGGTAAANQAAAAAVTTGFEVAIPLSAIGNPADGDDLCIIAVLSNGSFGGASFFSNQLLPGLPLNGPPVDVQNLGNPPIDLSSSGLNASCATYTVKPATAAATRWSLFE